MAGDGLRFASEHRRLFSTLLIALCMSVPVTASAGSAPLQGSQLGEEEKLERDFTDPLTSLPQVIIRDSYVPSNLGTDLQTNQLIIRPLIPRISPRTFLPFTQLIRPTFALLTVPSSRGGTRTEFGDLPVFDMAVLPWPDRKKTGLLLGLGPTFVFPTATSKSAGQGAWQAGPALGAIYVGIPSLLIGFIAQNPVSFASYRPDVHPKTRSRFSL